MNGLTLAYLGDAYYEYRIREYLIQQQLTNVNQLHKSAILFTSSKAQASIVHLLIEQGALSERELDYYKRGRNASSNARKNVDRQTYSYATGFEALIGGLYLTDRKRSDELIDMAISIVTKGVKNGKDS